MMTEETSGFGKFEYVNGSIYEGHWVLKDGVRIKQGQGELFLQNKEIYTGSFQNDQMDGYGLYKYACGSQYMGEWQNGKLNGKGLYEFQNGAYYDGDWLNNKIHGEGLYVDPSGQQFEGEFVNGAFQSKLQIQLKIERAEKNKQILILQEVNHFFKNFDSLIKQSESKQMKEKLKNFFANPEELSSLIKKNSFPVFSDQTAKFWQDFIQIFLTANTKIDVLKQNIDAKFIEPSCILAPQFNGVGQVVEFQHETTGQNWVIVHYKQ